MIGMPEGNGTSQKNFMDAFGKSHSGGGMDIGGGGGSEISAIAFWNSVLTTFYATTGSGGAMGQGSAVSNLSGAQTGFTRDQVIDAGWSIDGDNNQYFQAHRYVQDGDITTLHRENGRFMKPEGNEEFPWYTWGGQLNWGASAAGSLFDVGADLHSLAMYSRGIRGGVFGNYQLAGRNLSLFKNARMTSASNPISSIARWGGRLGFATAGFGLVMDGIGVYNYYQDPNSVNAVHPAKAGLNAGMSAYGLWVNPLVGALYFGIDAFYPGGWIGVSQTAERTEINERAMTGHSFFSNSALKQ
jgi:hypothetical protein